MEEQVILEWTSKVQIRKGTPSISLVKHLVHPTGLKQGFRLKCQLISKNGEQFIQIKLD